MTLDTATVGTPTGSAARTANDEVIARIRAHHEELAAQLGERTRALLAAAKTGDCGVARGALHAWYRDELMPHIVAEERTLYSAAAEVDVIRLLVCGMLTEHRTLVSLVADLALAREPFETALVAASTQALVTSHLDKENDLLLPALGTAGLDIAELLDGMHELLGSTADSTDGCGCGCAHETTEQALEPVTTGELDVRMLPHEQRHEIIFARLDGLAPGQALVIVNDHDPKPLRYQTEALWPDEFSWSYREAGPQIWRVAITRVG